MSSTKPTCVVQEPTLATSPLTCPSSEFCNDFQDYFDDAKESRVKQVPKIQDSRTIKLQESRFKNNQVSRIKIQEQDQDSRLKIQDSREEIEKQQSRLHKGKGTSFVVQVEGTSTWVVVTKNKRGYISCGSVQVEGTSTWLFKENKGGYIPCGSLLVKDFTRLKEISRTGDCLGTGYRHGLLPNQYKILVFVFFFPTLLISAVYFTFMLYFCLSYIT
ncbi:hypothetical protein GmHk_18G051625 [Glycine max]|nr:hypothetical protein GmHk_18G051625 [Glycine max]